MTTTHTDALPSGTQAVQRRYHISHGEIGVGLVLTEDQFDALLAAHEAGWDAVIAAIDLIRKENQK